MKTIRLVICVISALGMVACQGNAPEAAASPAVVTAADNAALPTPMRQETPVPQAAEAEQAETEAHNGRTHITLNINGQSFAATLTGDETVQALMERFPMTIAMSELNGNEKYHYMDALPASPETPGRIQAGDLMLYGNDCLVLFYESFSSGYSYTRLGSIDDPAGLKAAVGSGNVTVTFDAA